MCCKGSWIRCWRSVAETPTHRFVAILRELRVHQVDFIVVGGVAAVLDGAPVNTFDLDVVHSREPGNIARLLAALESLDARYRTQLGSRLKPDASHLTSASHQLLLTRFGPLDVLGAVGRERVCDDLLSHTIEIDVGQDLCVRVLNLEMLIAVKEEVAGEKDLAVLPVLRRTLEEKRRASGNGGTATRYNLLRACAPASRRTPAPARKRSTSRESPARREWARPPRR